MTRHSFSLVEVLVALVLISTVVGSLYLGISRSLRSVQLSSSKERVERLLQQAFRFASISGHVSDVAINKGANGWEAVLHLWEKGACDTHLLARSSTSISSLSGIETIQIDNREVQAITFRFFGSHGLCSIESTNTSLTATEFQRKTPPILSISSRTATEQIVLEPYCQSVTTPLPFPTELLQAQ